jgi:hypothetical protein
MNIDTSEDACNSVFEDLCSSLCTLMYAFV